MKTKIFMLDDDVELTIEVEKLLTKQGYEFEAVNSIGEANDTWQQHQPDIILLDLRLPDGEGTEFLNTVKSTMPEIPVIMMSGHGQIHHAVDAMLKGAENFLTKPVEPDHLLLILEKMVEQRRLLSLSRVLELEIADKPKMIIGASRAMQDLVEMCHRAAQSNATILVNGETGTGKHLIAHFIHQNSPRKDFPFVYVNCATLSEALLESDLFGHEKGAFTGAHAAKAGRVEVAEGGSLFLDEIGEIPVNLQAKILHFIEYGEFQRVGSTVTRRANTRIISATNRDLAAEVKDGNFREDLFYRLNVIQVRIPPLRERREDISPLLDHFIEKFGSQLGKQSLGLSDSTRDKLMAYSWPGNIRELENSIERAVVLSTARVLGDTDFPFLGQPTDSLVSDLFNPRPLQEAINEFKKRYIIELLQQTGGNQTEAARVLDIQRTYLNRLIKELNVKGDE